MGQALLRQWHRRGADLIALRSAAAVLELVDDGGAPIALRQICWQVGEEAAPADLQLFEQPPDTARLRASGTYDEHVCLATHDPKPGFIDSHWSSHWWSGPARAS